MTNSITNSPVSVRHISKNNYDGSFAEVLDLEEADIEESVQEFLRTQVYSHEKLEEE